MALNSIELENFRTEIKKASEDLKLNELIFQTEWIFDLPTQSLNIGEVNHYFKLKGTDNPILCIGLKNNNGEISWFDIQKKEYHFYSFNMDYFIESTKAAFTKLFNKWNKIDGGKNFKVLKRIAEIEKSYNN